jgi:putative membrane protein
MASALVASLHFLAIGLGLGGVFMRGIYLRQPLDAAGLRRLFAADSAWGVAALLWLATGAARAFGGLEKGTQFYLHNRMFELKLGLFALVLVLELRPMITFIRWRIAERRGAAIDTTIAPSLRRLNDLEVALVVAIVFVAGLMARGIGY